MKAGLNWLPMSVLALVLALALAFLYVRGKGYDTANYLANVALLRELKQLDASWELDVLKSRMGINTSYDALVDPLVELNRLKDKLRAALTSEPHDVAVELQRGDDSIWQAVGGKTRLVEKFKSHNSVLRNSLAFLPTAAGDVRTAARSAGRKLPEDVDEQVNRLLLDALVYSQAPTGDKAAEVQAELDELAARSRSLPAPIPDSLEIFSAHVGSVLREQPMVNGLLNDIAAVPVAARVDDLDGVLGREQEAAAQRGARYRQYLVLFAAALASLLLYAAVALLRSHAVIRRVNRELQDANVLLEQRVDERTRELREAQSELMSTARQAGMAEIANNVLHNVGNVLNSVNISAGLVMSRMRESKIRRLEDAVALMREHAADLGDFLARDERGRLLPGYLGKLAPLLEAERHDVIQELESLSRSVDHIKDIVATQQSYAGSASVVEAVQVGDLLEDALRINMDNLDRNHVTVVREFTGLPPLSLDKPRVMQVIVNLIRNAEQAMRSVGDGLRRLTLRAEIADVEGQRRLCIGVEDSGEGIAGENLARIFVHGFTTRKYGHGFGLHSCAVAAREMGGTLRAHSEGPGRGAAFTLELPVQGEGVS